MHSRCRDCDEDLRQQKRSIAHQGQGGFRHLMMNPGETVGPRGRPFETAGGNAKQPSPRESVWRLFKKLKLVF